MSPVTLGIDVTKVEAFIQPLTDTSHCNSDLTGDESGTTARRLVIEENTIGQVHTIGFAVVDQNPESILLRHSVRRTRVEGGGFRLGDLLDFSVQFGGGGLVETTGFFQATGANGIEHAEDTDTITVSGVL
jgi:hypothetical protein